VKFNRLLVGRSSSKSRAVVVENLCKYCEVQSDVVRQGIVFERHLIATAWNRFSECGHRAWPWKSCSSKHGLEIRPICNSDWSVNRRVS